MGYRRLFIMRKDLNMSAGKLAAQVGHCAEVYWLRLLQNQQPVPDDILENYVHGSIVKTICEARNKNQLLKAKVMAEELSLVEGVDFGLIYDNCLTELTPEEDDGTTLTGIWFRPLPDNITHCISKKYHLYM